jgi:hypothetical protein
MVTIITSCKKDEESKSELPDISVIDVSQESEWNYCVLGKSDYYYIKTNGSTPDAVYFHSSEANKNYSIIFTPNGFLDKVMVDDYVFSFRNPDGNKIDIGVLYPNGDIEILRGVETEYSWDSYAVKSTESAEAWSDVIRWTGRIVAGVPCGISAATAISSGGIATPIALWACGNYILSLSTDIAENELEIHNGFTEFVSAYGNAQTAISCSSGELLDCSIDALASALSDLADRQEELENRQDDLHVIESALEYGYGDVQITLTWDNTADLDLHVVDPNSEEIYYNHPYSNSGGILDVDDIDGYGPENIYWPQNEAPDGNYKVYVHHYDWEDPGYPTTSNYTVLVNAYGHIEKFTGTISLDGTVYITDFDQMGLKSKDLKSTRSITKSKK